jgi:hypothetical protein
MGRVCSLQLSPSAGRTARRSRLKTEFEMADRPRGPSERKKVKLNRHHSPRRTKASAAACALPGSSGALSLPLSPPCSRAPESRIPTKPVVFLKLPSSIFHLPSAICHPLILPSRLIALNRGKSRLIAPKKVEPQPPHFRFPFSTFHFSPSNPLAPIRGQSNLIEPKKVNPNKFRISASQPSRILPGAFRPSKQIQVNPGKSNQIQVNPTKHFFARWARQSQPGPLAL